MVTEKKQQKKLKPELVQAIKDFSGTGMSPTEVSQKLSVPYHLAYYYSEENKKRKAKLKRQAVNGVVTSKRVSGKTALKSAVNAKIEELEAVKKEIDIKIKAFQSLL